MNEETLVGSFFLSVTSSAKTLSISATTLKQANAIRIASRGTAGVIAFTKGHSADPERSTVTNPGATSTADTIRAEADHVLANTSGGPLVATYVFEKPIDWIRIVSSTSMDTSVEFLNIRTE